MKSRKPTTFHPFPRLPVELRRQIWQHAMPDVHAPAVYLYNWRWNLELVDPDMIRYRGFLQRARYVDIGPVPATPWVSLEARETSVDFSKKHEIQVHINKTTMTSRAVRRWNKATDVLYVGIDQWDQFREWCCISQPHMMGAAQYVRHLAVPYEVLQQGGGQDFSFDVLKYMDDLEKLSVVWGKQPELGTMANDAPEGLYRQDFWIDEDSMDEDDLDSDDELVMMDGGGGYWEDYDEEMANVEWRDEEGAPVPAQDDDWETESESLRPLSDVQPRYKLVPMTGGNSSRATRFAQHVQALMDDVKGDLEDNMGMMLVDWPVPGVLDVDTGKLKFTVEAVRAVRDV
ncbi:hypothetical protein CDD80_594 [Ophiocordyceps camponoti-rufipedis]|uniref:2EXR domain-containing protein n=1 Tax=Ophiocordyceps camponoti-rufipedis TaxID=2004952 RepID=A0A2C5YG39_9HYPO|nr:hypothetical protein CDD80_594 [Ophiocordyceps camponoti-rufipedis]